MQPFPTHTEKAIKQPSALATASLPRKALSREFIRLMKTKDLRIKSLQLFELTIWILMQENKCMEIFYKFLFNEEMAFCQCKKP